jgi:hypothetical protein
MSMIVVASAKGAPGVSTLAWELVARWPRGVVGIEADISGGSWSLRYGLSHEPGLVSLTAERSPISWDFVVEHSHTLGAQGRVVCAPPGHEVAPVLTLLEPRLRAWPQSLDVVVDVGRINNAVKGLCRQAELVVMVARNEISEIGSLQRICSDLVTSGCRVKLVVVGEQPHDPEEIAHTCGVALLEVLSFDPPGMERFLAKGRSRSFDSSYARMARVLADQLVFHPVVETPRDTQS